MTEITYDPMGRAIVKTSFNSPNKLTPECHAKILQNMRLGCGVEAAAGDAGIVGATLKNWLRAGRRDLAIDEDADTPCANLTRDVELAEKEFEKSALGTISAHTLKNWCAAAWLLERKFPQRYARVDRLRLSGDEDNDKPISTKNEEEAKNRLLEKLATIAERALVAQGKEDEPIVIEGQAEVIDAG